MKNRTAALLALPLLLVGCAPKAGEGGGPTATKSGRLKLVYIPKNTGNPYFDEVDKGFKEAAGRLDLDYTTVAPAKADATSQLPIVKDQIQRGVDVIAISPNSEDALDAVLQQARGRGIAVITVDADLKDPAHRDAAVLPADFSTIGPSQIELLGKLTNYEGDFAILSATTDAPNQNAWIAKMKESLKEPKYARMRLVDTVYGDDEPQKSTAECEGLLAKYPNLRGIVSPTSVGLAASAQVLERSGRKGLALTGLSTPNQLRKFVKDGTVASFQLWSPKDEGSIAAYLATQLHGGNLKPAEGGEIDVPGLGKRRFSAKMELTGGPILTFDKTNIEKYDF